MLTFTPHAERMHAYTQGLKSLHVTGASEHLRASCFNWFSRQHSGHVWKGLRKETVHRRTHAHAHTFSLVCVHIYICMHTYSTQIVLVISTEYLSTYMHGHKLACSYIRIHKHTHIYMCMHLCKSAKDIWTQIHTQHFRTLLNAF